MANVWPQTIVQTCIIHLIRNTFRYASRKYWDAIAKDLKPIYTAVNAAAAALARSTSWPSKWGSRYPAIMRLWDNAWEEFIPFLDYDVEIRTVICSTNAIESLNARYRRAVKARGHFPTEQAALKCLYLVTRSLDPTGHRPGTMDHAVEASTERVRDHLRRPHAGRREQLTKMPLTPLIGQTLCGGLAPLVVAELLVGLQQRCRINACKHFRGCVIRLAGMR